MNTRVSEFIYPQSIQRCQHIKVNGIQCGSPALKSRKLCHFHQRWDRGRIQINANRARRSRFSIDLPLLEDANSIQVALMQTMRLLLTNEVDHKTAALLFYGLQTASTNLRHTKFEPRPERIVIDPGGVPDTCLGDDAWYKEEFKQPEADQQKEAAQAQAKAEADAKAKADAKAVISAHLQKTFDLHAMARRNSPAPRPRKRSRNERDRTATASLLYPSKHHKQSPLAEVAASAAGPPPN